MRRRHVLSGIASIAAAVPWHGASALAQTQTKIPRIGYIWFGAQGTDAEIMPGFQKGLADLGYVEGRNILIEYRYLGGDWDRAPVAVDELVALKVELFVATSSAIVRTAMTRGGGIPIVALSNDPVGAGFAQSLARPGGIVTGVSMLEFDQYQLRALQLLKETAPNIQRVAVLRAVDLPSSKLIQAGKSIAIEVMPFQANSLPELKAALDAIHRAGVYALMMLATPVYAAYRKEIIAFVRRHRLPAIYGNPEFTDDGGLMVYGPSFFAMSRRLASFVDRMLKGAKPAELPIEQAVQFDFKINLKTARDLGLTVPALILQQATEVIE